MIFADKLIEKIIAKGTPCIVGIDPAIDRMPKSFVDQFSDSGLDRMDSGANLLYHYSVRVIDAVHDLVPAIKPQIAYFERYGSKGIVALEKIVEYARKHDLLVILDAKRGDIDATSIAYAEAYLGDHTSASLDIDCMTLHPYMGTDSLQPFITLCNRNSKGVFICVMTSNPGAGTIQKLDACNRPVYQYVAEMVSAWATDVGQFGYSSIGAVVGATYPDEASVLRRQLQSSIFLVPGVGAQKGSIASLRNCFNPDGLGAVVSSSRGILYPHLFSDSHSDGPESIRRAAISFITEVKECLPFPMPSAPTNAYRVATTT